MIFLCFVGGGRLCRSTFDVGISSKLTRLSSVHGTSMSGNHDTKVCRHSRNHVAKIGLSGQKLATFRLVADMLPTCCRHYQTSQVCLDVTGLPLKRAKGFPRSQRMALIALSVIRCIDSLAYGTIFTWCDVSPKTKT